MDKLLKPSDVAELLNVSSDTVRDLIHAGKLRACNVNARNGNKNFRIRQIDLEQFLRSSSSQSNAPSKPMKRRFLKHLTISAGAKNAS
jgi:excisionase family DNA binding protein